MNLLSSAVVLIGGAVFGAIAFWAGPSVIGWAALTATAFFALAALLGPCIARSR